MGSNTFYVIDTSSLINIRMHYPVSVFTSFWKKLDELVLENRLGAPQAVFEELSQKDDDYLFKWAKSRKDPMFNSDYSEYLLQKVSEIMGKFPGLIDENSTKEQADPFVIAMAVEYRDNPQKKLFQYDVCVVTEESLKKHSDKPKIPFVCGHYNIPCCRMVVMAEKERWKF
jgi:hypothetical protein